MPPAPDGGYPRAFPWWYSRADRPGPAWRELREVHVEDLEWRSGDRAAEVRFQCGVHVW